MPDSEKKLLRVREISQKQLTKNIRRIFKEFGSGEPFKPILFYDEPLDVIRAVTADCSVTEVRVTPILTLLERNHLELGQARYVGFNIEAARISCGDLGLPTRGTVSAVEILQFLSDFYTQRPQARGAIREVAQVILEDHHLDEVRFPSD